MFLMSSQVEKSGKCQLRDKKHQYFSIVSLPTDSVIVDHAVCTTALILFIHVGFLEYLGFKQFKLIGRIDIPKIRHE
jgi:hypothetical protein